MIDTETELLIPISAVHTIVPSSRPGKKLHYATIWRWVTHGVRGIKLETMRFGRCHFTTREALWRFATALSGDKSPTQDPDVRSRGEGSNVSIAKKMIEVRKAARRRAARAGAKSE